MTPALLCWPSSHKVGRFRMAGTLSIRPCRHAQGHMAGSLPLIPYKRAQVHMAGSLLSVLRRHAQGPPSSHVPCCHLIWRTSSSNTALQLGHWLRHIRGIRSHAACALIQGSIACLGFRIGIRAAMPHAARRTIELDIVLGLDEAGRVLPGLQAVAVDRDVVRNGDAALLRSTDAAKLRQPCVDASRF